MGPTASAVANILQFEVAAAADPFQASLVYSTPKFQQKWIMAFTLHPNTDYQRGIQNPGIIDELSSAQDLKSCLQACTTVNMNSPVLYQGNANPPCNGLVFKEGYCWLKSGINETSVYDSDSTAYAAILHLLE